METHLIDFEIALGENEEELAFLAGKGLVDPHVIDNLQDHFADIVVEATNPRATLFDQIRFQLSNPEKLIIDKIQEARAALIWNALKNAKSAEIRHEILNIIDNLDPLFGTKYIGGNMGSCRKWIKLQAGNEGRPKNFLLSMVIEQAHHELHSHDIIDGDLDDVRDLEREYIGVTWDDDCPELVNRQLPQKPDEEYLAKLLEGFNVLKLASTFTDFLTEIEWLDNSTELYKNFLLILLTEYDKNKSPSKRLH